MTTPSRKSAHILSTFNDSGTGERFEAGSTQLIDAGAHANYLAAGLIGDPPAKPAASKPAKRSAPRKSATRAKTPASKPAAPVTPAPPPASGEGASGS